MGLFSSKKKTYVSSVVYNLAGDGKRTNYMTSVVVGNVMNRDPMPMGEAIISSLLGGPGVRLRSFARWARQSGYLDLIGQTSGNVVVNSEVNQTVLAERIPHDPNQRIFIQNAEIDWADYEYWAARHICNNKPALIDTDWEADYDENINVITIKYADGTTDRFSAGDYRRLSKYIYATYNVFSESIVRDESPRVEIDLGDEPYPPVEGWSYLGSKSQIKTATSTVTTTTDITYSDGQTPNVHLESVVPTTASFVEVTRTYYKDTYIGSTQSSDGSLQVIRETMEHLEKVVETNTASVTREEIEVSPGVIKTTVTTINRKTNKLHRRYSTQSQTVAVQDVGRTQVFIYRQGSGDSKLDEMFGRNQSSGTYFPFIPIRINNRFLSNNYHADVYAKGNRATQNAIGAKYQKIEDNIADNDSLRDIDYAYMAFGVSLNTKESASLRYLYQFFKMIQTSYDFPRDYQGWATEWEEAQASLEAWIVWNDAQSNRFNPLFGTPAPVRKPYPEPPNLNVHVYSRRMNYDMRITWNDMIETSGNGVGKAGAKKGDLWFTMDGSRTFSDKRWVISLGDASPSGWRTSVRYRMDIVSLWWQYEDNKWRRIQLWGLKHRNMIYGGKSVDISAFDALRDDEESGFIIPLHEQVFKDLPLTVTSQMANSSAFIVFNCYQVVKKKWYQSGFFKFLLIAVAITISFYVPGAGAGIMGANAAVGAAIGFTGVAAAVAGAIANAVAAMIVTQLITTVSTTVLGDKLGFAIAAIASVVAISVGTSIANGQTMTAGFGNLMKAENILKLTVAGGGGYQEYLKNSAMDYAQKTQDVLEDYKEQSRIISQAYEDNLGDSLGLINPLSLTDPFSGSVLESADDFLSRTLMTGSDIARMTLDMIGDFTSMTTTTVLQ